MFVTPSFILKKKELEGFESQSPLLRPYFTEINNTPSVECTNEFNQAEKYDHRNPLRKVATLELGAVSSSKPFTLRSFVANDATAGQTLFFYSPIHFPNLCSQPEKQHRRWIFGGYCTPENECAFQIESVDLTKQNEDFPIITTCNKLTRMLTLHDKTKIFDLLSVAKDDFPRPVIFNSNAPVPDAFKLSRPDYWTNGRLFRYYPGVTLVGSHCRIPYRLVKVKTTQNVFLSSSTAIVLNAICFDRIQWLEVQNF